MVTFAGVSHVALTVTDLDVSQQFYTEVLDFVLAIDVGTRRICIHPGTGFSLTLHQHEGAKGGPFSELTTGLDHLGFTAETREELDQWARRFDEHDVVYTPVREAEFGYHLNFRDPDDIALEFSSPKPIFLAAREALAAGHTSQDEIATFFAENLGVDTFGADR